MAASAAGASHASVGVRVEDARVALTITDDGRGRPRLDSQGDVIGGYVALAGGSVEREDAPTRGSVTRVTL